jgi:hypothetical protein
MRPASRLVALGVVLLLGLSACGGGSSNTTETPALTNTVADVTPTATVDPDKPAALGKVQWAAAVNEITKAPTAPVDKFPVETPAIYAAYPIEYLPAATFLTATWTYNGQALPGLTDEVLIVEMSTSGWVEFHLFRGGNDPWPAGTYGVTVSTDTETLTTDEVELVRGT